MDTEIQPPDAKTPSKRFHSSSESDSESQPGKMSKNAPSSPSSVSPDIAPKYLIISERNEEMSLSRVHSFAISHTIKSYIGPDFEASRIRSGHILLKLKTSDQYKKILKMKEIACSGKVYPIIIKPHASLNTCKGVAKSREFTFFETESEILECLTPQGVTQVKRCSLKKNGEQVPTGTVFLTFNSPVLPRRLSLGFTSIPIDPFIPNPMRCFRCQKLGHTIGRCQRNIACAICAAPHENDNCDKQAKCVNCDGDHPSFSKKCPVWIFEKEILHIKTTENKSYPEARKLVEARMPNGVPYARVVSPSSNSTEHCNCCKCKASLAKPYTPVVTSAPLRAPALSRATTSLRAPASVEASTPSEVLAPPGAIASSKAPDKTSDPMQAPVSSETTAEIQEPASPEATDIIVKAGPPALKEIQSFELDSSRKPSQSSRPSGINVRWETVPKDQRQSKPTKSHIPQIRRENKHSNHNVQS